MVLTVPYNLATKEHHDRGLSDLPFYDPQGRPGFAFWSIPDETPDSAELGTEYARLCLERAHKEDLWWLLSAVASAMFEDGHLELQDGFWAEITRLAIRGLEAEGDE